MAKSYFFQISTTTYWWLYRFRPRPTQKSPSGGSKKDKDLKKRQKSDFIDSINFNVASDPKIWSVTCPSIVESFQK